MATYTIPLWLAIEFTGGSAEYVDGRTVLTGTNIGLEHYPIFDEAHRVILNGHIVDRYWNEEIGHETVADFRRALAAHMNLRMPAWNKAYELALIEFNPLITTDMEHVNDSEASQSATSTSEQESNGSTEQAGTSANNSSGGGTIEVGSRSVFSDLPGVPLSGNGDYASNLTDGTNRQESASTSTDSGETTSDTTSTGSSLGSSENEAESASHSKSTSRGYSGIPGDLIRAAQAAIMNIDLEIVESLEPLFFSLWQNADEMFPNRKMTL